MCRYYPFVAAGVIAAVVRVEDRRRCDSFLIDPAQHRLRLGWFDDRCLLVCLAHHEIAVVIPDQSYPNDFIALQVCHKDGRFDDNVALFVRPTRFPNQPYHSPSKRGKSLNKKTFLPTGRVMQTIRHVGHRNCNNGCVCQ